MPWLVEGVLATSLTLLSGAPKSGKSMLAAHLVESLLTGKSFLNHVPVSDFHNVGWIGYDANWKTETRQRLEKFSGRVILFDPPGQFTIDWDWEKLAVTAINHSCSLLIIDHLYGLSDSYNLDHAHEAKTVLAKIRNIYNLYNLPVLLIAQAGKGAGGRAAHSVHIEGEARQLLQLEGRGGSGRRKLRIIGNNTESRSYSILLGPKGCDLISSSGKEANDVKPRNRVDSDLPKIARELLSKSALQNRKNQSELAKFDVQNRISGRNTIDSSRTLINNLKKAELLTVAKGSKEVMAGPKLNLNLNLNF